MLQFQTNYNAHVHFFLTTKTLFSLEKKTNYRMNSSIFSKYTNNYVIFLVVINLQYINFETLLFLKNRIRIVDRNIRNR